jgi:hypothetical protein
VFVGISSMVRRRCWQRSLLLAEGHGHACSDSACEPALATTLLKTATSSHKWAHAHACRTIKSL